MHVFQVETDSGSGRLVEVFRDYQSMLRYWSFYIDQGAVPVIREREYELPPAPVGDYLSWTNSRD